ncbi:MAG: ACT domain-containing protein [Firmicutes bacterium]|nr:ACT domain-containing protein [Bacillota bacterium]
MNVQDNSLFLVKEEALPSTLRKTLLVKEYLKKGICKTVNEAVEKAGVSRAAYYKYRDYIFPFTELSREKIVTLALLLDHQPGVLSQILAAIARARGNLLTINQGLPLQGVANVSVSIETREMEIEIDALLSQLRTCDGVRKIDVIGQGW